MKNSTSLKIGIVIDDSLDRNDGVQQYVRTLGNWLQSEGHDVHYLAGQSKSKETNVHSLSKNVGVRFNGNRLTIPLPAKSNAIKSLLSLEKYDVLHVQMPYSPAMAGKIVRLASPETAVIGTFHILPFGRLQQSGNKALAIVQKRQLRRFDAICSVSAAAQQFAKTHYRLDSKVIPNMIDASKWHSSVHPHPKRIVYLGRLVHRKGCAQLLNAILALPQVVRDGTEVLIAGDGPERKKLEQFVIHHHMDNVRFLGYIEESQKVDLLASAQVAVFPSLGGESFGIVLIEAMTAGASVVIGGNNLGYQSVMSNWPGTLFDPRNASEFGSCLQKYLASDDLRQKVHIQQQVAVRKYDVNVVGKQVVGLYEQGMLHRQQEMR